MLTLLAGSRVCLQLLGCCRHGVGKPLTFLLNVPGSLGNRGPRCCDHPAGDINAAAGLPASRATLTFGIYGALARVVANCALDYTRSKPNGGPLTYIALSLLSLAAGWTVALLLLV